MPGDKRGESGRAPTSALWITSEAECFHRDEELCCSLSHGNLAKSQHAGLSLPDRWPTAFSGRTATTGQGKHGEEDFVCR